MQYAYAYQLNGSQAGGFDPDAKAYIAASGVTDSLAKDRVNKIVKSIKGIGLWSGLSDAFLLGSKYQSSSTTIKSLNLLREATGTSTFTDWSATFNGSSDGYTFSNANRAVLSSGFSWLVLYQRDYVAANCALIGANNITVNRGPYMQIGYSPGTLPASATALRFYSSTNGVTAPTFITRTNPESLADWSYGMVKWDGSNRYGYINEISLTDSVASVYHDHTIVGLGKNAGGNLPFDGRIMFAAVFSSSISQANYFALRDELMKIFSGTINFRPAAIFEGNSLTASATGGGTNWPTKLLAKSGWNSAYLQSQNYAVSGEEQTVEIEPRLSTISATWKPYGNEDRLLILWSGTNDITAGKSTGEITASLERYATKAKADGFRFVILTITNVGSWGAGPKKTVQNEVNSWILTTGATIADQVIDLNQIGITYPKFLDPNDTTYYADTTHHNDSGRELIANFVNSNLSYPVYTPY